MITPRNVKKYYSLIFLFTLSSFVNAQIAITKPVLSFSFLCQSQFINTTHNITFTASPIGNINSGNVFILEMSQDNFATTPLTIPASIVQVGSQFTMTFTLPTSTFGTNHRLRVRSTSPAATSPNSDAFDAYYIKHNQEIALNNASGIDNIAFCTGGDITLFIFNSGTNSSPLFYPELTYVWKRKQLPNDLIIGTGSSIVINQPGEYFVETNYGVCTPSFDSRSRIVTVTQQSSPGLTISSSVGSQICEGSNAILTGSLGGPGYTFQWYNGSDLISGATNNTYTTTTAGNYRLTADNGVCVAESNTLVLSPISFTSSINQTSPVFISQGESATVIVTTSATSPTFQWYKDNVLLTETSNTLTVNSIGDYKVVITQTAGCIVSEEIEIKVQKPEINEIPNLISPNNDGVNDTWVLPSSIISSQNLNVQIFNASGKQILNSNNYANDWPTSESDFINSNAVFYYIISKNNNKFKQGTITVIK